MSPLNRVSSIFIASAGLLVVANIGSNKNVAAAGPLNRIQRIPEQMTNVDEGDVNAPVDYGSGPGVMPKAHGFKNPMIGVRLSALPPPDNLIPLGSTDASTAGMFGPPVTWPLIPIHVALLPDGRVMSYGTSATGQQSAKLNYDVWSPSLGTDTDSHMVLPNSTNTDIFCGAQSVLLSGDVLTSGGDLTVNGARNSANNETTIFSPIANSLSANTPMSYARWYGSLVALPNGQLGIFGGRQNVGALNPAQTATTPEIYDPSVKTWTPLTGATSVGAFGTGDWYYPRSYVAPGGSVFVLSHIGQMFFISTAGTGAISRAKVLAPAGNIALPSIPFAPGKVLSLRMNQQVVVVDYSKAIPVVTATDSMDQVRYWANGSLMADGKVLITGGSESLDSPLTGVAYQAQIWDPATGHWTAGAIATKARLYHSTSLLLPDATVLTAGGGAPGPVKNLNAEVYYPPYLYNPDGSPAQRPVIVSLASSSLNPGDSLDLTVDPTTQISRLTIVRIGSDTHSNNSDQRFIDLAFIQNAGNITAPLTTDTTTLVPGYYLLFAFSTSGVPSVANIIGVM